MDNDQQPVVKADAYQKMLNKRLDGWTEESLGQLLLCDKSTVNRLTHQLSRFCRLLEILGLKIVPVDRVCVREKEYLLVSRIAAKAMANEETARALFFDDVE